MNKYRPINVSMKESKINVGKRRRRRRNRIFEEKSSLHSSNHCFPHNIEALWCAHIHTRTHVLALQAWSATIWQREIFIQPGRWLMTSPRPWSKSTSRVTKKNFFFESVCMQLCSKMTTSGSILRRNILVTRLSLN